MCDRLGEKKGQRKLRAMTWKIYLNLPKPNSPKVVVRATQSWSWNIFKALCPKWPQRERKDDVIWSDLKLGGHLELWAILFQSWSKIRSNSKLPSIIVTNIYENIEMAPNAPNDTAAKWVRMHGGFRAFDSSVGEVCRKTNRTSFYSFLGLILMWSDRKNF